MRRTAIFSRLWKNHGVQRNSEGMHFWDKGRTTTQDAQKGQTSHPPNPGGYFTRPPRVCQDSLSPQDAPCPKQGHSERLTMASSELARLPCPLMVRMSPPLRALSAAFQFSPPLFRGVAEAALYCAHRTIYMLPPSLLVISQGWGLIDLPLRALSQFPISFSKVAWSILNCARRTSTFLLCAFREQEDGQATLPILLRPRVARARGSSQLPHPPFFSILSDLHGGRGSTLGSSVDKFKTF